MVPFSIIFVGEFCVTIYTRYYLVNTPGHPTGGLPTAGLTLHYEP